MTADRWARMLRSLGHQVTVHQRYDDRAYDVLIALHARRSYPSIRGFRSKYPNRGVIVALTGTDLYRDLRKSASAQRALEHAWRIVVLQPMALLELSKPLQEKTRVILQSVRPIRSAIKKRRDPFQICVLGHLRAVKDPFRAAMAARLLPEDSRIRIIHLGAALSDAMAERARSEQRRNPRYRWLGELPRSKAMRLLAGSQCLVQSSKLEGGANAVSEAVVHGVPVIASRIAGTVGQLGAQYPGFFPVGDTEALASMLCRIERDAKFHRDLQDHCRRIARKFHPDRERKSWAALLQEHAKYMITVSE